MTLMNAATRRRPKIVESHARSWRDDDEGLTREGNAPFRWWTPQGYRQGCLRLHAQGRRGQSPDARSAGLRLHDTRVAEYRGMIGGTRAVASVGSVSLCFSLLECCDSRTLP